MNRLVIHQSLHGYSEGHRLLQGSIKLNDESGRLILRMSDLSGSNVVPGFEEYLTGYPVEAMSLYALAKTWYASEMPRPGSVWTHTLFLSESALSEISDLQILTSLFKRPSANNTKALDLYSVPIEIEDAVSVLSTGEDGPSIQIADLIETMYREGKENILISSPSSRLYESAIFRVWSQQWPHLREKFTFCTGVLSSRGLGGKPFDVQCAPTPLMREIISATAAKHSHEMNLLSKTNQELPPWFARAVKDANSPTGETFRQLLWQFADVPDKNQFVPLAQLIEAFLGSAERDASDLIRLIAERFPSKDSAKALKSAFFGKGGSVGGFKPLDEGDILVGLACTSFHEAFDATALGLRARARDLCETNAVSAALTFGRILRAPLGALGEEILAGMIEAITPTLAREVTTEQPQFLSSLFRAKPELGVSSELWLAAGDRKRELLEALISQQDLNDSLKAGVAAALLESDSDYLVGRVLDSWREPAVFGVFTWLAHTHGQLSERVRVALSYHVASIAQWACSTKDAPEHAILIAAHIIAPFTYQFRQFDTGVWLKTYRSLSQRGDKREADYFATMLLTLGFQNSQPNGLALVEECFERVHKIAWDDVMPDDTWIIIDPIVPRLWWHREWDRCERLRRGIIEAFVKFRWPIVKLADCVKSDAFLQRVVESARHVDGGREFVSQKF